MSYPNPQVDQLLHAGVDALTHGDHASAQQHFAAALAISPDIDTQHYVAYNLYQAGCYAEVLTALQPYYQASSAPSELAIIALSSAIRSDNTHVATFLVSHYQDTPDPRLAAVVTQANQFLAAPPPFTPRTPTTPAYIEPYPEPDQHPGYYEYAEPDEHSSAPYPWLVPWLEPGPKRTTAVVVLVVILLLGWGVFRPKSTTSVASNSTYCTTLHTIATAPPTDLSSPSQRAQAKQWMATLDTSAPASIKSSTHAFVTTTDKLIANPLAGTPAQAASLLADKTAMVAWAQTNCPAGTMPSAASPTTHPTATPTPTTAPAAATSGISGGPQTLPTPEGSPVSVNITSAQANPPKIEGAADTSPTILAIELTVSNNGTTAVDLSNLLTSDPSITLGEGVTSLTPQFDTTDPLAPGATTTGWATLDYDSATAAPYTIVLSFANVSSSTVASWTISS